MSPDNEQIITLVPRLTSLRSFPVDVVKMEAVGDILFDLGGLVLISPMSRVGRGGGGRGSFSTSVLSCFNISFIVYVMNYYIVHRRHSGYHLRPRENQF